MEVAFLMEKEVIWHLPVCVGKHIFAFLVLQAIKNKTNNTGLNQVKNEFERKRNYENRRTNQLRFERRRCKEGS